MANKILKEIDTAISKIVISIPNDRYEKCKVGWRAICPISSLPTIEELPLDISDAIKEIIPSIKEIRYVDCRKTERSYKCRLTITIANALPGMNKPIDMVWNTIFNSDVYQGVNINKISENELKMYSLSFALETLALIPIYLKTPIYETDTVDKVNLMKTTWMECYKIGFPQYYKRHMDKSINTVNNPEITNDLPKIDLKNFEVPKTKDLLKLKQENIAATFLRYLGSFLCLIFIAYYGIFAEDSNPFFWVAMSAWIWYTGVEWERDTKYRIADQEKACAIKSIMSDVAEINSK